MCDWLSLACLTFERRPSQGNVVRKAHATVAHDYLDEGADLFRLSPDTFDVPHDAPPRFCRFRRLFHLPAYEPVRSERFMHEHDADKTGPEWSQPCTLKPGEDTPGWYLWARGETCA